MGRFNKITLANIKNLFTKYRKTKFLYKLVFWLSFTILPSLFLWVESEIHQALPLAIGLAFISVSVHVFVSYTAYITVLIPNILHLMVMPFPFGYYWILQKSDPDAVFTDVMQIYTPGAVVGSIATIIIIWAVFVFTRGKMWLTFSLVYIGVDILGMLWAEAQPSAGLLIPTAIIVFMLFIRSKLLHRLIFKDKHITHPDNIFSMNNLETSRELTKKLMEEKFKNDTVIPLSEGLFEYMIITENRVFLVYPLTLNRSLGVVNDLKKGIQIKFRGNPAHVELGQLMKEARSISKKYSIQSADITPIILGHGATLPKDKQFMAVKVEKKNASVKEGGSFMGLIYLIHADKATLIHGVWRKHSLTKRTQRTLKKYSADDIKQETEEV